MKIFGFNIENYKYLSYPILLGLGFFVGYICKFNTKL